MTHVSPVFAFCSEPSVRLFDLVPLLWLITAVVSVGIFDRAPTSYSCIVHLQRLALTVPVESLPYAQATGHVNICVHDESLSFFFLCHPQILYVACCLYVQLLVQFFDYEEHYRKRLYINASGCVHGISCVYLFVWISLIMHCAILSMYICSWYIIVYICSFPCSYMYIFCVWSCSYYIIETVFPCGCSFDFFKGLVKRKLTWRKFQSTSELFVGGNPHTFSMCTAGYISKISLVLIFSQGHGQSIGSYAFPVKWDILGQTRSILPLIYSE